MLAERHQDRLDADADLLDWEDEEEDEEDTRQDAVGADRKLRVLTEKCSTCIFRPGNPMRLDAGRVRGMVEDALTGGGYITCHQTLTYGDHPGFGPAVCRGFHDAHGYRSNLIRIMGRLGGITEVAPPVKEETLEEEARRARRDGEPHPAGDRYAAERLAAYDTWADEETSRD